MVSYPPNNSKWCGNSYEMSCKNLLTWNIPFRVFQIVCQRIKQIGVKKETASWSESTIKIHFSQTINFCLFENPTINFH